MGEIYGDNQASDMHSMIRANEEIKKVIQISAEVNLIAINAMLVAKRSGEKSRGFTVVASELRVFSRKLEDAMTGLGMLIFGLVRDAARMQKQSRERRYFQNAMARGDQVYELIAPIMLRKEETMRMTWEGITQDWRRLRLQLGRALQLCETGGSLSRSAKIEAVHGGDMSATLKQVANQIDQAVNDIFAILKLLRTRLEV